MEATSNQSSADVLAVANPVVVVSEFDDAIEVEDEVIDLSMELLFSCIELPDAFAAHFTHVASLSLAITREGQPERLTAQCLVRFTNLTELDLHNNGAITDDCLSRLANLVRLNLSFCKAR
jgi:hypothetical protein